MSSSYEKSVKGATKIKLAPPKAKYIEHILSATRTGEAGVGEIFRTLQFRLRDTTWTIAFKALIVVHIMIREGDPEATLRYLAADYRKVMAFSTYTDVQTQGRNIRAYSEYLIERARSYAKTKQDYVGAGQNRLKRLSVDKGLLRETESVQSTIKALIKCDMFISEPENEISLTAFRLLTMDLLVLFQVMNEGTINILEHYFEMSKPDAERALAVYKTFAKQTDQVVSYLQQARAYEHSTRFKVPSIRHAPTSLAANLEEYLRDKDFETNRRQYLAQREAKSRGGGTSSAATGRALDSAKKSAPSSSAAFPEPAAQPAAKGPAPDLIDFFSSIEQNQQPMAQNSQQFQEQMNTNPFLQMQLQQQQQQQQQQPQQTGFVQQGGFMQQQPQLQQQQPMPQQQTNPFGQVQQQPQQIQMQPTGAGFGGYSPQPQAQPQQQQPTGFGMNNGFSQQQSPQQFMPQQTSMLGAIPEQSQPQQLQPQQTSTNPFRASMMPQQTGSNPFARQQTGSPFGQQQQQSPQQAAFSTPPPPIPQSPQAGLTPQRTGTNPFAKQQPAQQQQQQPGALISQATGSTNPFRQSAFVNHNTNTGWQTQQGTMGGLEHLPTIPVFPRPGQGPDQQQQQQQQMQMQGQMMPGAFTGQPQQQPQQQHGQQQQANGSFAGWM